MTMLHAALSRWQRQHPAKDARMSRRSFISCTALGAAAVMLPVKPAAALMKDTMSMPGTLPERAGILPWSLLQQTNFNNFTAPATIPPQLAALHGQQVKVEGYVMAFDDAAQPQNFLLMALPAHCPYCLPGGMGALMTVNAAAPIKTAGADAITLSGILQIDPAQPEGFVFTLQNAVAA